MEELKETRVRTAPPVGKSLLSKLLLFKDLSWLGISTIYYILMAAMRKLIPRPQKDLTDKVILITGSANGIGKELVLQLAALKASIACLDISENDNLETVKEANQINGNKRFIKAYNCDVSDPRQVQETVEEIIKDFGRVDILINNAALIYTHKVTEGSEDVIEKVFRVNLFSNFWMVRAVLPSMRERNEGHIVFLNTVSAVHGVTHCSTYCASKWGQLGFMHALEEELRSNPSTSNIKLTSVHPYFVHTNKEILKYWNSRLPPLELKKTVATAIVGIRRELRTFSIPGSEFGFCLLTLSRLLPLKLYQLYRDIFYADISILEKGLLSISDIAKLAKESERNKNKILSE